MTEENLYYQRHIFCCTNERPPDNARGSCKARGAAPLRNYLKARVKELGIEGVRVNGAGCLDRCELGPTMVIYPEGIWYTYASKEDVEEIIESHVKNGKPVERFLLKRDQTDLTEAQKAARTAVTVAG